MFKYADRVIILSEGQKFIPLSIFCKRINISYQQGLDILKKRKKHCTAGTYIILDKQEAIKKIGKKYKQLVFFTGGDKVLCVNQSLCLLICVKLTVDCFRQPNLELVK